ncbi:hypothetical protein Bca4012_051585 [Brassica carinata]
MCYCFSTQLQSDKQQNLPTIWVMRKRFHWKLVKPSMPGPATDQNKRKRPIKASSSSGLFAQSLRRDS